MNAHTVECIGCTATGYEGQATITEDDARHIDGEGPYCDGCADDVLDHINSAILDDLESGASAAEWYEGV